MGCSFRDGRLPPQKALKIIMSYMWRASTPVYLGFVSLEVGWNLARTQEMMEYLEETGMVRRLDESRLRSQGHRFDSLVYELT